MVEAKGELGSHSYLKVPIAKIGKWAHPQYGSVEFTDTDFNAAISNFKAGALGFEPHLSFGHLDEEPASTDSARKRGDLKYLMREGEGNSELNGYFAVPPNTAQVVSEKGYEYASGEFIRDLMDKNTGAKRGMAISRVALTNTPYLPWGEEGKIQLLSQTGGNTPQDMITSVIKLSMTGESMTQGITEQAPPIVPVPTELNPPTPVTVPIVTTTSAVSNTPPALDIEALTASILARVNAEQEAKAKAEREAMEAASKAHAAELEQKLTALNEEMARVKSEASLYSNHTAIANQQAEKQMLMSMGASAVQVEKYAAIMEAVDGKFQVVKLSQGGEVKESPLRESIRELLLSAFQQQPVMTTQLGFPGAPSEQEDGVFGAIRKTIEDNKQAAANRVKI